MDKFSLYLEIVPLPVLAALVFVMGMIYLMMPANTRFYAIFLIMPAWLAASLCPELGPLQAVTKISSGLLFLLVAIAAMLRPVPRRPLPGIIWLYLGGSLYLGLCLIGAENAFDELLIQFQWIMLVLAAIATVATVTRIEDLQILIKVLTAGSLLAILIPLSAVLLNPGEIFGKIGRFSPWGAMPNLIGITFLMGCPLFLYAILTTRSQFVKLIMAAALISSIGMTLITGSRQVAFSLAIAMALMCFPLIRRPGVLIAGGVGAFLILPFFAGLNEEAVNRLSSFDTSGRLSIWWEYFKLSFRQPLGLLGTQGQSAHVAPTVGQGNHAHNVFLDMLYVGGWPYLLTMASVIAVSLGSMWRVWKARFLYTDTNQRFLIHMLAALVVAMFLQGMSNQVIFHPTYAWSFLCVILTFLFIALGRELPQLEADYYAQWDDWDEEYAEDEEEFDGHAQPATS